MLSEGLLLLIIGVALCALAWLATRFGFDSRPSAWSKEAELSAHGVSWEMYGGRPVELASSEFVDLHLPCLAEPAEDEFSPAQSKDLASTVRT